MKYKLPLNIQKENLQYALLHFSNQYQWQPTNIARKRGVLFLSLTLILSMIIYFCTILPSPLIACVALAGLAMLWLVALYPWSAALFVFLCAGLPSLQIPLPGHTVRPVEVALSLSMLVIFLIRPRTQLKTPHVFALLFLAIAVVSFLHVPELSTNATVFGANKRLYNLFTILLALFCGTFLMNRISNMSSFLTTILVSNIPLYLISLAQAFKVSLPAFLSPDQNPALTGDAGRLVGPFDGAATFGIYLTGLFAVSLSCSLLGICRRDRLVGTIMLFATILALVGSGTRSALIAMGVILFVALVMTKRFKLFLGFIALTLGGLAAFPTVILSHFTHADTSTSNRLFLWNEAFKLILSHPLIGIGLEQFHYYYARLIISQSTQLNQHGISVHNQYLEWGMEGGILWLILGVSFLLSLIIVCGRSYFVANHQQRIPLLAAMLAALAVVITGFLDVPFDDVEGGVFFCMLAGLALSSTIHIHTSLKKRSDTSTFPLVGVKPVSH